MKREYSTALPYDIHAEAARHLIRADRQEDLCFAIWFPSEGKTRTTALVRQLILPREGERLVHGNASFLPEYFERALGEAISAKGGLAFLHSHPGPGWQDMSPDDIRAEEGHAAATKGATGLPLVGLTVGTDEAWSARFWEKTGPRRYARQWCSSVRVVGDKFNITYHEGLKPAPRFKEELSRTISAWGEEKQSKLARLRIGIVGAGSVGSIVAEGLARTGISELSLIDFDTLERVNVDRCLHATTVSADQKCSKVGTLARGIKAGGTADNFRVNEVEYSVCEEEGYRAALDCDVLFCCVDRPWGRCVSNFIAYAHLIPVIDGGINIEVTRRGAMRRADWKAHTAMPNRSCLECLGQFDPSMVQAEREGWFEKPDYIKGLPETHSLRRNENVIAFSLNVASFEILQLLTMVVAPLRVHNAGQLNYHFVPGIFDEPKFEICKPGCPYSQMIAMGDRSGFTVTGLHASAQAAREARMAAHPPLKRGILSRLWSRLRGPKV